MIEFELLGNHLVWLAAGLAEENLLADFCGDVGAIFREFHRRPHVLLLGCRFLVPPPSARNDFCFCHREKIRRECLVIREGAERHREVLAVLTRLLHMRDQLLSQISVSLLGVLFVHDAKLLVLQAHASEEIRTMRAFEAILAVRDRDAGGAKLAVIGSVAARGALVHELTALTPRIEVHARFTGEREALTVPAIFDIFYIEAVLSVLAVVNPIAT